MTSNVSDVEVPAGFVARAIDPDADSPAITTLCDAAAIAEYGASDVTLQMVRESYNSPSFDPANDGRIVVDGQGRVCGLAEYYDQAADHVAPFVYLRVHPDLLEAGIGDGLRAWAERRGATAVELAPPDLRVALHANASGVNEPMQRLFERAGWAPERVFWTMEIDLGAEAPAVPRLPQGITIRTSVEGQDEPAIHAADMEAFADHYGHLPQSLEQWLNLTTKMNPYDPSLWFLAVEGDEIAGIALCLQEAAGQPDQGWVGILGVRPAWRGQGLGLALLKHAFAELHRRGQRRIGLMVDSQSLTGATRLYERAGMHVARDARSYAYVLREGREIRPV